MSFPEENISHQRYFPVCIGIESNFVNTQAIRRRPLPS